MVLGDLGVIKGDKDHRGSCGVGPTLVHTNETF